MKAVLLAALAVAAVSCEDEDNEILQGNWYNTYQYFPGTPRGGAEIAGGTVLSIIAFCVLLLD